MADKGPIAARGCVYFNFGTACALQLLVSVHSLRKVYDGPVTVFLVADDHSDALKRDLETLGADVRFLERLSKSFDRHRVAEESPYATTLLFDSDIIFQAPIDAMWEPTEREGVMVTAFYTAPYGVDGTPEKPGFANRHEAFTSVKPFLAPDIHAVLMDRLLKDGIDINVGVMGISRPKADAFLDDWARHMELTRGHDIPVLDELMANALVPNHPHHLAGEDWNCPADEYFRQINIRDAVVLHYFADSYMMFGDQRIGRNATTWAGRKWYEAYYEARGSLDLSTWRKLDGKFERRVERPFENGVGFTLKNWGKDIERAVRRVRDGYRRESYWDRFR